MRSRFSRIFYSTVAGLALCLMASLQAHAQAGDAPKAGGEGDWQPVQTQMIQPGESFQAKDLVGAAYGFIWVMVAGFVLTVWLRANRLEKEIESLRAQISQKAHPAGGADRAGGTVAGR